THLSAPSSLMAPLPLSTTLFPYTTLFRSGAGAARAARDGRYPEEGRRLGEIRRSPRRRPHAGPHERPPRRGERALRGGPRARGRSEEHTSELQSRVDLVCRLLLEKKKQNK